MLTRPFVASLVLTGFITLPVAAQDFAPHKAAYAVNVLDHGKLGAPVGNYAYELKLTCEAYFITQRLRLEAGGITEQQSQMTESRDGRTLQFEHRSMVNGKQTSLTKGEAVLDDKGVGQAHFSQPEGQTAALTAGTMFPIAIARATAQHAKENDGGFDGLFFYGEKPKPPQAVNTLIGRVPKRLAGLKIPDGADALVKGRSQIYYRAGFFDADGKSKGEQATFEMSSLMLDNGIELWGTHEERDGGGIEYRITRLEAVPLPTCK